jgi:hypothetical protein
MRRSARVITSETYRAETPMQDVDDGEKFTIGFDRTNQPVTRAVREMSAEELVAAINLHVAALDEADVRSLDRLDRLLRLVARRQREVPC